MNVTDKRHCRVRESLLGSKMKDRLSELLSVKKVYADDMDNAMGGSQNVLIISLNVPREIDINNGI